MNKQEGKTEIRTHGLIIKSPQKICTDSKCPFHGKMTVHGRMFVGTVVSDKMQNTVTVEWDWQKHIAKYERFEKRKTKLKAHNPPCINAKDGEKVRIIETRPISKTKKFVVVERLGENMDYKLLKIRAKEETGTQIPVKKIKSKKDEKNEDE